MPSLARLKFLSVSVIVAGFLSGCVSPPSPEIGLQELRAQAEARLLQDAKLAFVREDYSEAILLFNRFVKNHPQSPLVHEAQWWLARSYQQSGNVRLALARFQRLARLSSHHPYRQEARLRANTIIETLGIEAVTTEIAGYSVPFQHLSGEGGSSLLATNRLRRGTVVLLDLGCSNSKTLYRPSKGYTVSGGHWRNDLGQSLQEIIRVAQKAGQAVYLGVSLPCLGFFSMGPREDVPQWHDWFYEPRSHRVRISPNFSLFSPEYQEILRDLLAELSQLPIAGMVFQENQPFGPFDGLAPLAVKKFETSFDVTLDPPSLFTRAKPMRTSQRHSQEGRETSISQYSDLFWKWVGWKSRERLRVMEELVGFIRQQSPHLQLGVEIHPESLYVPVYALANFSEDWVQTSQLSFDFFVTRFPDRFSPRFRSEDPVGSVNAGRLARQELIQQMTEYLGDPRKVWVRMSEHSLSSSLESFVRDHDGEWSHWPEGVGKIVDLSPVP